MAVLLLALGVLAAERPATAQTVVADDWALTPSGLSGGDKFRLIFGTSTTRNATSSDIATYNTFVQDRAAAGHSAIQAYSSGFRVVGCTADTDATVNTSTTSTDVDARIYWLGGNKVADDYADFYNGDWDDEANSKNESGNNRNLTGNNEPFTGCAHNGTEELNLALGKSLVRVGSPNNPGLGEGPIGSTVANLRTFAAPFYGLSEVFQVPGNAPTVANPILNQVATAGTPFSFTFPDTTFNDADGDPLSYTATLGDGSALPSWLTFTASTRTFAGTPGAADVGTLTVKVTATDTGSATVDDRFDIVVSASLTPLPPPTSGTVVSVGWPLTPSGLSGGDKFRLIFATSTTRDATSTDIRDYNTFVQTAAAAGHSAIQAYSSGFRVVGCTAAVNARDSTATTFTTTNKGVPIYWLGGNKVADDYEDFYDGSWDDETNTKNELGSAWVSSDSSNLLFTGCGSDGTSSTNNALGASHVLLGGQTGRGNPMGGATGGSGSYTRPFYGLSEVFEVTSELAVAKPVPDQRATKGAWFSYTLPADTFVHPDGDPLTYTATQGNGRALEWLTFTASTRTFSGKAPWAGTLTVKVTATDPGGASASDRFDIVVGAAPTPPPPTALVSNMQEVVADEGTGTPYLGASVVRGDGAGENVTNHALQFHTGSLADTNNPGFAISELKLHFVKPSAGDINRNLKNYTDGLTVSVHSASSGLPGTEIFVFRPPYPLRDGVKTFTAPKGAPLLEPDKDYFIVFEGTGPFDPNSYIKMYTTSSDAQDGLSGWSINDTMLFRNLDTNWSSASDWTKPDVIKMALRGREFVPRSKNPFHDASLSALEFTDTGGDKIALRPAFASTRLRHDAMVPYGTTELTVSPTTTQDEARVERYSNALNQDIPDADPLEPGHQVPLAVGQNRINIWVRAEDGKTVRTYGVVVTRRELGLKTLALSDPDGDTVEFVPGFAPAESNYRAFVPNAVAEITIDAKANSDVADVVFRKNNTVIDDADLNEDGHQVALSAGQNDITIRVRQDDIRRDYHLTVTRTGVGDPLTAALTRAEQLDNPSGFLRWHFELLLSEPVWKPTDDMREHVFGVTNGQIERVGRVTRTTETVGGVQREVSARWRLTVTPNSRFSTTRVRLTAGRDCAQPGALCTTDGGKLANAPSLSFPAWGYRGGPGGASALAAAFEEVPLDHDGETPFTVHLILSAPVKNSDADLRDHAVAVDGGSVEAVERIDGRSDLWALTVAPDGAADVVLSVEAGGTCGEPGVLCTAEGESLSKSASVTIAATAPTAPSGPAPLTVQFENGPANHDGADRFTVELVFSAAPHERGNRDILAALEVSGGTKVRMRRVQKDNAHRRVTIEPDGDGAVTLSFPATTDCAAANALCTAEGGKLEADSIEIAGPQATVLPPTPAALTARFDDPPKEHQGKERLDLYIVFSAAPEGGRKAVAAAASVKGGAKWGTAPVDASTTRFRLATRPSGWKPMTVTYKKTEDCADEGALCTAGGGKLENELTITIPGPVAISVADANVQEGDGAKLAFAVTLDRARDDEVRVDYATEDGTAKVDEDDYIATSGTLTFAAGETSKTVEVEVLDDAHDEGEETMVLRLSNPVGARIADGEATGTIENTDAMPRAWLARFGRTVADQVLDAVEGRMRAPRTAGAQASLAGQRLGLGPLFGADAAPEGGEEAEALRAREREAEAAGAGRRLAAWLAGESEAEGSGPETRTVTPRELLLGSSFSLSAGTVDAPGGSASLWGRAAVSRFDGREDDLVLDGEVASGLLGADWARERWTAGLVVSHSRGEGGYRSEAGDGVVSSTLTGLYPWGRVAVNERVSVWGVAGYGSGTLTLTPEGSDGESLAAIRTDLDLAMGAVGVRGTVVEAPPEGGVELSVTGDALGVRTTSAKVRGLAASEAGVTRLRLGLEGSWKGLAVGTGTLEPRLELGARHDGGDAETGAGLDVGGGLVWSDPARGVRAELGGRGLLTHESDGFGERGFAGSLVFDPAPASDRGVRLTLTQTVGAQAAGGMDALLGPETARALGAAAEDDLARRRLEARLGYGFAVFGGGWTGVPEVGLGWSESVRETVLGWRLAEVRRAGLAFGFDVEGARRESVAGEAAPEHRLGLGLGWRLEGARRGDFEVRFEGARREPGDEAPAHEVGVRLTARW